METGRAVREHSRPVTGWRAWVVRETPEGVRLGSVLHDLVWPHGRAVLAECRVHEDPFASAVGAHPVPGADCNCGFHAARDPVDALSYARGRDESRTVCRVVGEVVLWGHVLETESGWRASHAYPGRLYVPDLDVADALVPYSVAVCGSASSPICTVTPSRSGRRSQTWRRVVTPT